LRDHRQDEPPAHAVTERYFDHHTTQPLHPAARRVLETALDRFGDPLRSHERGRSAHRTLDGSREAVADAIGAQPDEIVVTAGGTEAISLALFGVTGAEPGSRVVASAVEH